MVANLVAFDQKTRLLGEYPFDYELLTSKAPKVGLGLLISLIISGLRMSTLAKASLIGNYFATRRSLF